MKGSEANLGAERFRSSVGGAREVDAGGNSRKPVKKMMKNAKASMNTTATVLKGFKSMVVRQWRSPADFSLRRERRGKKREIGEERLCEVKSLQRVKVELWSNKFKTFFYVLHLEFILHSNFITPIPRVIIFLKKVKLPFKSLSLY